MSAMGGGGVGLAKSANAQKMFSKSESIWDKIWIYEDPKIPTVSMP